MFAPITFITESDDRADQIRDVFGSDYKEPVLYQILQNVVKDYQGTESFTLVRKCSEALDKNIPCPLVTDVTSVSFNALGGLPGTLVNSFDNKLSSEEMYKLLEGWGDKSAYILYAVGLLEKISGEVEIFQRCLSGTIVKPLKSTASGWEAIFQPDGYTKPYADLPKHVRYEISAQKKALRALKTYLISNEFFS